MAGEQGGRGLAARSAAGPVSARYVSVAEAARESGAPVSAVRAWSRSGQVRSRTAAGPRGERTEVALSDVERLVLQAPRPAARTAAENQRASDSVRADLDESRVLQAG